MLENQFFFNDRPIGEISASVLEHCERESVDGGSAPEQKSGGRPQSRAQRLQRLNDDVYRWLFVRINSI